MAYRDITAAQLRAARAMLGWSQDELAARSGVGVATVKRMETIGPEKSTVENIDRVSSALQAAGAEFKDGWVRISPAGPGPGPGGLRDAGVP